MAPKNNNNSILAALGLLLLSLGVASSIAINTPNEARAQDDEQRGLLGGIEREQSGEAIPGQQPADIGGSAALNATTVQGGGSSSTQSSSACTPTQTAGGSGGTNVTTGTTTTMGSASKGNTTTGTNATNNTTRAAGNQSPPDARMNIEQACMALQNGDIQGAMMSLSLALSALGDGSQSGGGGGGNMTTTSGSTTGGGGIATDNPASQSDNPYSDFT